MTDRIIRAADVAADYRRRADRYSRQADDLAAAGLSESAEIVRHWADYERATAADYDRISNRGKPSR